MLKVLTARSRSLGLGAVLFLGAAVGTPAETKAEPVDFVLDPAHTSITFFVSHVGYADLAGMFLESTGSFSYDEEQQELKGASITVNTDSVFTNHDKRDQHLKSADFLNTQEFPEMTFVAKEAEKLSSAEGKISGELTLLGVTRSITLDAKLNKSGNYPFGDGHYAIGIDATGIIKRSDFGMSYGVDGGIVGDEVKLVFGFEGIRQ